MNRTMAGSLAICGLVCLALAATAFGGKYNKTVDVGVKAPAFQGLTGIDDKTHSLSDLKDAKAVLVVFTCNHCPIAQNYEDRLVKFTKEYADKGVAVVAINVNTIPEDRLDKMKERAEEKGFNFVYLYDPSQKIGQQYGATVTPHCFVLDGQRQIAYMGAFDNNQNQAKANEHYVQDAVDAVLAGRKPKVAETQQFGCSIKYDASALTVGEGVGTRSFRPQTVSPDPFVRHGTDRNSHDRVLRRPLAVSGCGEGACSSRARPGDCSHGGIPRAGNAPGLEFFATRPVLSLGDQEMMARVMDPRKGGEVVIREIVTPSLRQTYADLQRATADADLVVSHVLTYAVPILAEVSGMLWVSTVLSPMILCSAYEPPAFAQIPWLAALRPLGPRINGMLLRAPKRISRGWADPIRQFRRELGLSEGADPLWEGQHSPFGVLAMFSSCFARPQPDWPPNTRICGFPFYDDEFADNAGELCAFIDDGEPPVAFTLGSSAVQAAGRFYDEAVEAARLAGKRAVLVAGPHTDRFSRATRDVLAMRNAPFHQLFPRCAVVVHAGGVGTTALALRAGVPQVVVPFSHDQFDNGNRVQRMGCGVRLRGARPPRHWPRRLWPSRGAERREQLRRQTASVPRPASPPHATRWRASSKKKLSALVDFVQNKCALTTSLPDRRPPRSTSTQYFVLSPDRVLA